MTDPAADAARDPVAELVDEFLAARRRGEPVEVAEFAARAGERAEELRELLESALFLEDMKSARPRGLSLHAPRVLGDYKILGEIGRGGMGVVYEAEQITLGRRVALKVLPTHALRNEKRLERFKREAQTAAKLHHTNIVPIFGVGEQDGDHYYVMQLIVGRSLDDIVRAVRGESRSARRAPWSGSSTAAQSAESAAEQLRKGAFAPKPQSGSEVGPGDVPYYRSVASLGMQAADALAYAHAQGTLHRDIKPANLILDDHGVLWITDFGLAKVVEEGSFTLSGDLVGTLQYMAPEQLSGQADPRTDVHGLGLVLYELATLKPGFTAETRGELIEKVRNQEPPPARKVRPGVPRDLETIIRKATAKDPAHRYASAAELRDDLERFLQDRPIRARRVSNIESGWRWCRRNRLLASAGALAALGLVSTAVVGVVGYMSTAEALEQARTAQQLAEDKSKLAEEKSNLAEQNRLLAEEKSQLAQENVALALEGFEDLFTRVVGADVLRPDDDDEGELIAAEAVQRLTPASEAMLEQMLRFYDRLAEKNLDNAGARQLAARAFHRVGEIHYQLGKSNEAIASYERAVDLYGTLVRDGVAPLGNWLQVQNGFARVLVMSRNDRPGPGRSDRFPDRPGERGAGERPPEPPSRVAQGQRRDDGRRGVPRDARARELATAVIKAAAQDPTPLVRFECARAHDLLGVLDSRRDRWRGGPREPHEHDPGDPRGRRGGDTRPDFAAMLRASVEHHRQALAINDELLAKEPANIPYRQATARSCRLLAGVLWMSGDAQRREAEACKARAVELLEALVAVDKRASLRFELFEALLLGVGPVREADDARAASLVRALAAAESMLPDLASATSYRPRVLFYALSLGRDDRPRAFAWNLLAAKILDADVRAKPDSWMSLGMLRHAAIALVRASKSGDGTALAQALEFYNRVRQRYDEVSLSGSEFAHRATNEACAVRVEVASELGKLGRLDLARAELAAAEEVFVRVLAAPPGAFDARGWGPPTSRRELAAKLAEALTAYGDPETGALQRAAELRKN